MIYLIDDKKLRQSNDFGWSDEKLNQLKDFLQPIYNLEELENRSAEIFQNGNIIFYHESFLNDTSLKYEASIKRNKLENFIKKNDQSFLAYFSGSKEVRSIENRVAFLPVTIFYENLEIYLEQYKSGNFDLLYLLYGHNPYIERDLVQKLDIAIAQIEKKPAVINFKKNLFISTDVKFITSAILDADEKTLYFEETDQELNELVNEWLQDQKYDNIFIPMCFGSSLSDFNGLRFATHIRCSISKNQLTNIFIYSFVGIEYLLNNPFFNILKTENVYLVDFNKSAIQKAGNEFRSDLEKSNLIKELLKLKLSLPRNYYDSHSIANVWGVYQLARNANINIDEINGFEMQKLYDIYFKWLITTNNLNVSISEEQKTEQLRYTEKLQGVKVLDKIDLSKFKRK